MPELIIPRCQDFSLTGDLSHTAWQDCDWIPLTAVPGNQSSYDSRFKILYSAQALYLAYYCQDERLSNSDLKDFDDIFEEDVVECFLQTDSGTPLYFEYEASPLGSELPILVHNNGQEFMGWRPWHYEGERRCSVATAVHGGEKKPGAQVESWTCEIRIPFALFKGLGNSTPQAGTRWRGNFYRIDYDRSANGELWSWSALPDPNGGFHQMDGFGDLRFA